ncbi:minichromosome maintenance- protein [Xylographa opegraphella]|nr:minichromosome maintenance- protein [Xylographa opegraphella]
MREAEHATTRSTGTAVADEAAEPSLQTPELYESFSDTHLSRRILPHTFLARTLEAKRVVLIPDLLREIKAPDFCLPASLEASDFVVLGSIASKSAPLSHKGSYATGSSSGLQAATTSCAQAAESDANVHGKYMVFTLTDLRWTLDLYLFTTAYTRFWKLTPGTVIAILNPSVMPPPRGKEDTGRWSLVLSSSDDTVLEIGTARDLGFCKATKRDGKACASWVDARKTAFCEWHVDRGVENCRRGRMEVQGMSAPFAPGGRRGGRTGFFGGKGGRRGKGDEGQGLLKEGRQYDRESRSTYFIAPSFGRGNAASLLDADETGAGRGMSREEALRKRLAEREKEKDVAKKLGEMGNGTGAEYLRLRHGDGQSRGVDDRAASGVPVDAGALGLLGNSARNVQLSPLKRKASGGSMSASRKKTRFVTAKGIREAGRESLGVETGLVEDGGLGRGLRLPDEDDLDIV